MGYIYCLIGKSGTGKDTALENVLSDSALEVKKIIPYTTRPKRENETEGVNYHYVTLDEMNSMEKQGVIIEKRFYDTVHGRWFYFTADLDIDRNKDYIIITTQKALKYFFRKFGEENIFVIYLKLDDKTRLERCINRESMQAAPNYKEVCRRFIMDESDFDEHELSTYSKCRIIDTSCPIEQYSSEIRNIIFSGNNRN
ncbi:MAG: guanylate kinase [Clostridia bacterium]|nr:guanylate kinase [Clostridia bacterium]